MDKPKNGNTITIKINGKERPLKENKPVGAHDPISEQRKRKDLKEFNLSGNVELEAAAAKEPLDDDETFDWILPTESDIPEIKEYKTVSYEKKTKPKMSAFLSKGEKKSKQERKGLITPIFLAVFFAVLLGTILGLTLLKIVLPEQVIGEEQPPQAVGQEQPSKTPIAAGSVNLTLPPLSTAVVQEGVYTTRAGAEQIQATLKAKGTPAEIIPVNGKFTLIVGVADRVADAKIIGNGMKASGIDTFAKEFVIAEKTVTSLQAEEKKLLELSPPVYQILAASATSASISNGIPAALKENFAKQASSLAAIDKKKLQNKEVMQIQAELEAATAQLKIYEKTPTPSTLNLVQQHLLSFLASYQRL